ncbi:hypothetical protein [Magnetospirillum sulfuroxidans]|uniref:Uncharacterized protein n=1 Tax=Magnetospirillum sulfuroxidans TaxID=611300 RepID=A0ABS5IGD5_9PROT|nr:hypothetical protein [Magnetospirillum sulfuroxidans]MBR9973496.1 hypothetical protein [Magnetospirillum sulfuroxidans]
MSPSRLLTLAFLLIAAPVWAQAPTPLTAPIQDKPPIAATEDRPVVEDERPDFQPLRPVEPEEAAPAIIPVVPAAPARPPIAPPLATMPPPAAPLVAHAPAEQPSLMPVIPAWAVALLLVAGAMLSGLLGVVAARSMRRAELNERRRSVAASLAVEMETRRLAFDAVPLPPNVDAGVSFVSAVISMAGIDCAFRAAQGSLFLLAPPLAANVSVHYAAVQRVADFVKGQSMAAAVRMLQANRLGGHPCPDAGAMREAHVEMAAAFRGLDKVILSLRALQR